MRLARLILFSVALLFSFMVLVPATSSALFDPSADVCGQNINGSTESPGCSKNSDNPVSGSSGVIAKVVQILAVVIGIAAVIMIIISGIQFATSGGEAQKVATARQTIIYSALGIIIAAIAQSIVLFVLRS